jgi:hypothetical protein
VCLSVLKTSEHEINLIRRRLPARSKSSQLENHRSLGRQPRVGTATGLIRLIVGRVTSHLQDRAARAPKGAATVFAPSTGIRRDLILFANVLACPNAQDEPIDEKGITSHHLCVPENVDRQGNPFVDNLAILVDPNHVIEHQSAHHVASQKYGNAHNHEDLERSPVIHAIRWTPQWIELHARHDLAKRTRTAKHATPKHGVAATVGKAVADAIAPTSSGNVMRRYRLVHNGCRKGLALIDTCRRLCRKQNSEGRNEKIRVSEPLQPP